MATVGFGTNLGTDADETLGGRVLFDEVLNHYTLENVILGRGGNDSIQSMILPVSVNGKLYHFSSRLDGGDGNDTINGNAYRDVMTGGRGNDFISGDGKDEMYGGSGIDMLFLNTESSLASLELSYANQLGHATQLSNGSWIGGFEKFAITAGAGNDIADLSGADRADGSSFQGGVGRDILIVDSVTRGTLTFNGQNGVDVLQADLSSSGQTILESTGIGGQLVSTGLTIFSSTVERFVITTGAENDSLTGGGFVDHFVSGDGHDSLTGGGSADYLNGQAGNDTLNGGTGSDSLLGGAGRDSLTGGGGNDTLIGGTGADILTGSTGADVFVYLTTADSGFGAEADRIRGFATGVDTISLRQITDNPGSTPLDAFTFVDSFSGTGAQVRAFQNTANHTTVIEARLAGDEITDFSIVLVGLRMLTAEDFTL